MSASATIGNLIFVRGFDVKIKMCLTLLLRTKLNTVNLFSKQYNQLYNWVSVRFYELCQKPDFHKRISRENKNVSNFIMTYQT